MKGLNQNYGSFCGDFTAEYQDYSPRNGLIVNHPGGSNPASAFYATEVYMGLPQCDFQANAAFQFKNSYNQNGNGGIFGDSQPQIEPYLGSSTISPSVVNNQPTEIQYIRPEGSYANSFISFSETESEQLLRLKRKLLGDVDDSNKRRPFDSVTRTQDLQASQHLYATHLDHVKQFGRPPSIMSNNNSTVSSSKTRIRWTQELHDQFIECVNQLGGPEKATPKAILKLMDNEGLTIFHIKSHLQKYRNAKYVPEPVEGSAGKSEKKSSTTNVTQIDPKTGVQLRDALKLQLDVQHSLHEQLEIQKKLQLRIEEQGRQLKMMFDQQQKTTQSLMEPKTSNNDKPNNLRNPKISVLEGSDDDNNNNNNNNNNNDDDGDVDFPSIIS